MHKVFPFSRYFFLILTASAVAVFSFVCVFFGSGARAVNEIVLTTKVVDTNSPVISDLKPSGTISDDTPTLSVKTDENATCKFSDSIKSYDSMEHV